jgi:probable O-glycosylation ligase (exosortase A-associated)
MRDLIILALILGGSLYGLRAPWIGAMVWTCVSLASPHVSIAWNLSSLPAGIISAVCTLLGLLVTRERQDPMLGASMWVLLVFVLWTTVTLPFSFHFDSSFALWLRSIKIWAMLFVTVALIDTRKKLEAFLWVCVLSIGYFGFKGGLFTIATGGGHKVWGPGGFIEDNNAFAVAMLMTIPMLRYLQMQMTNKWHRHFMTVWMLATAAAVLGSQSRGALLGIGAMTFFLWMKGKGKFQMLMLIVGATFVLLPFMPDTWWDRMGTIGTYDQDESAQGRFDAWGMAWELAKDRFPFGGGFMVWTGDLFAIYAPKAQQNRAAHSIYFQILGEHGWAGLTLFLAIGLTAWYRASQLISQLKNQPEKQWAVDLARMCQVSLIGFAAGGAFLSLAYFDLPYNCVAMIALAYAIAMKPQADTKLTVAPGSSQALKDQITSRGEI